METGAPHPATTARSAPTAQPAAAVAPAYCGQCGEPAGAGGHERCARRLELEPPRYCAHCRRRMVVQVVPAGWSARCVEHGTITSG